MINNRRHGADTTMSSKAKLLKIVKDSADQSLFFNLGNLSDAHIAGQLAPFWFHHVTADSNLTPLQNAREQYPYPLRVTDSTDDTGKASIDDDLCFCYPEDEPQFPLFAIVQNGGAVLLYSSDIVWFEEPCGFRGWARMD